MWQSLLWQKLRKTQVLFATVFGGLNSAVFSLSRPGELFLSTLIAYSPFPARRQRSRLIRTADGRGFIHGASSFACCVAILHRHFSNGQSRFRVRSLCVHHYSKEIL